MSREHSFNFLASRRMPTMLTLVPSKLRYRSLASMQKTATASSVMSGLYAMSSSARLRFKGSRRKILHPQCQQTSRLDLVRRTLHPRWQCP